jgi:hypothetical protein
MIVSTLRGLHREAVAFMSIPHKQLSGLSLPFQCYFVSEGVRRTKP